jgi:hypothetical protein
MRMHTKLNADIFVDTIVKSVSKRKYRNIATMEKIE